MGNSEKKEKITYDVLLGENMEDDLLEQVMEIDTLVYEPIDKGFVDHAKTRESERERDTIRRAVLNITGRKTDPGMMRQSLLITRITRIRILP